VTMPAHPGTTVPRGQSPTWVSRVATAVGAALFAINMYAVAASAAPEGHVDVLRAPLATSISTFEGTWASVPMGHLDQPLNTFWQLFFFPSHGERWSNHAGQLGIADNGGLLLAARGDRSLLVAVRPSNRLEFSAVASTTDGRSWAPVTALEGNPLSLAAGADGQDLALLHEASGDKVLTSDRRSSSWQTLVTAHALASSRPGRACAPLALTSVAVGASGTLLVGAACGRAGVAGVFVYDHGAWRSAGPRMSEQYGRDHVQVLSLRDAGSAPVALFSVSSASGEELVEGWAGADGRWRLSTGLFLKARDLVSVGPTPGGGEFVVYRDGIHRDGTHTEKLDLLNGPGAVWQTMPLPNGTATVAFPAPGRTDALSVNDTVMTDWELEPGASHWAKGQVTHVDILFGSSN
jgi:hypothetical protein